MTIIPPSGINGFAELVRLGFKKNKDAPAVFATGCSVTLLLQDGQWEIDILLPNGESICVYATPENIEPN